MPKSCFYSLYFLFHYLEKQNAKYKILKLNLFTHCILPIVLLKIILDFNFFIMNNINGIRFYNLFYVS